MTRVRASSYRVAVVALAAAVLAGSAGVARPTANAAGAPQDEPLTIDHYVRVRSAVPSMTGQMAQVYVRERALPSVVLRGRAAQDRVVLFVHGAGTPAEVVDGSTQGVVKLGY